MPNVLQKIRTSLSRDEKLPLTTRLAKGVRYVASSLSAPLYLRFCDSVGPRARTIGRPDLRNGGEITIGSDLILNSGFACTSIATERGGRVVVGDRVAVNYGVAILARNRVAIGNDVSIGPYCVLDDMEGSPASGSGMGPTGRPIVVEDGAWLAARVTLLPGARVGAGSVITAGSIVSGEIPAGVVAGGIPARVLRSVHGSDLPADSALAPAVVAEQQSEAPASLALPTFQGVVLADFTVGDLETRLRSVDDGVIMGVVASPYDQVVPWLMQGPNNGGSDFAIVWTRPESAIPTFQRAVAGEQVNESEVLADIDAFCDVIVGAAAHWRCLLVPTWVVAPHQRGMGMLDARPGGLAWLLAQMNQRLMQRLSAVSNVYVLSAERWHAGVGRTAATAKGWYLGKVAMPGETLAEATRDFKAAMRGLTGQARKLVVVDLDDTMWGGIVGDAGWENLNLGGHDPEGEAFVDFQRGLKALTRRGIVLAIASKNTEEVALEAIRNHPGMVLTPDDFVTWRINWNDKAANIADMAAELNLGLQSIVFLDDNPVERARVREALPEVLVPDWPADKMLYPSALSALRCFDAPSISREDAERTAMYASERKREAAKASVGSIDEWLMSLGIRVQVDTLNAANVTRVTQLFNKTNQLNLTTRRLTEAELVAHDARNEAQLFALSVGDRFGDAGLTGILGMEQDGDTARVTDFILSCRVMGRRIEETMVHLAVEWARQRKLTLVDAHYLPTKKNKPCLDFWMRSGFEVTEDQHFLWRTDVPYELPSCVSLSVNV